MMTSASGTGGSTGGGTSGGAAARYRLPVTIRTVEVDRSGQWLAAGWRDFLKTPTISLLYGGAFTVVSFLLTIGLLFAGLGSLILPLAGGFVIVAPILVVGLYDVSRRLEQGRPLTLNYVLIAFRENIGQLSAMGVVLLILWFVWVEIAIFLFVITFHQAPPPLHSFFQDVIFSGDGAILLIIGTLVGAGFALTIFTITAVSIPLIFDRPIDVVTAISISVLTVRANWRLMFGWAALIALVSLAGLASFFIGLAVAMPVLAYGTWHAYRDLIGSEDVEAAAATPEAPASL